MKKICHALAITEENISVLSVGEIIFTQICTLKKKKMKGKIKHLTEEMKEWVITEKYSMF